MAGGRGRTAGWLAVAAVVALATAAAHAPAWQGVFVYDDVTEIGDNPGLRTLWPPWVPMFTGGTLPHRPLPYYTFALNVAAGGLDTRGFHAVNLAIHLANGGLLAWLTATLLARLAGRQRRQIDWQLATATAAVWLVHPLAGFCVDYLYQRMELLAATAVLAALACFLKACESPRPSGWLAGSIVASSLGMCCKENAVVAPAVVLLVDWLVVSRDAARPWMSLVMSVSRRPRYYAALFLTPLLAVVLVLLQQSRYAELGQPPVGPVGYLLNQPLIVIDYLRLAVWPDGLCLDRYRLPETRPWLLAAGMALVAAALVTASVSVRRLPAIALTILLFLGLLAPTSSLIPVYALMADQRMYLPLAVLVAAVVAAAGQGLTRLAGRWLAVGTGVAVIVCLAAVTWQRAGLFQSRLAIWQDVTVKAPDNPRGWQTYGLELLAAGRPADAIAAVDRSLSLKPDEPLTLTLRAHLLVMLDRPAEAVTTCKRLFTLDPPLPAGSGSVHPRHGIRYAILAAALAAGPRSSATDQQIETLIERAEQIDGHSPETRAMLARAQHSLQQAAESANDAAAP